LELAGCAGLASRRPGVIRERPRVANLAHRRPALRGERPGFARGARERALVIGEGPRGARDARVRAGIGARAPLRALLARGTPGKGLELAGCAGLASRRPGVIRERPRVANLAHRRPALRGERPGFARDAREPAPVGPGETRSARARRRRVRGSVFRKRAPEASGVGKVHARPVRGVRPGEHRRGKRGKRPVERVVAQKQVRQHGVRRNARGNRAGEQVPGEVQPLQRRRGVEHVARQGPGQTRVRGMKRVEVRERQRHGEVAERSRVRDADVP